MSMSIEEAGDKCLGQEGCNSCPQFCDTCDGQDYACKNCFKEFTLFEEEDYLSVLEDVNGDIKRVIVVGVVCSSCGFKEDF